MKVPLLEEQSIYLQVENTCIPTLRGACAVHMGARRNFSRGGGTSTFLQGVATSTYFFQIFLAGYFFSMKICHGR